MLTLHDAAPLRFNDEGSWPASATESARRARLVLASSEFSAQEVRALLGVEHVEAVPLGVDPACFEAGPLTFEDRQNIPGLHARFIVYAGGSSKRKNLPVLAAAWAEVNRTINDAELIVCGPPSAEKDRLFAGLTRCRLVGQLERGRLLRLIRSATALVTPSLYEGFGLPVLEAMAAGTVVVSARTSSLIEVGGDCAMFAQPTRDGLFKALTAALDGNHDRRIDAGREWARGFGWELCAERHAALYLRVLKERR